MPRCAWVMIVLLAGPGALAATAGCGRLGFERPVADSSDAVVDTAPDAGFDVKAACAVLLHMNETAWIDHSGAGTPPPGATDLFNECDAANPGLASGNPGPIADPIRGMVGDFNDRSCVQLTRETGARATTAVTTSAWLRMTGDPAGSFGVVSKRVDVSVGAEYNMFVWTDSRVYADIDDLNDRFSGIGAVPTGTWTQITMVYDGAQAPAERVRIYLNGMLDKVGGETSATIPQSQSPLSIGCLPIRGIAQSFVGQLDDVGVWTRAFSDADVTAWYEQTRR